MKAEERVIMSVEGDRAWVQVRVGKSLWCLGAADSVGMTEGRLAALRRAITEAEDDVRNEERKQMFCGHPRACLPDPRAREDSCLACVWVAESANDEQDRCCEAIRAACTVCKGTGKVPTLQDGEFDCGICGDTCGRFTAAIRKPPAESDGEQSGEDAP